MTLSMYQASVPAFTRMLTNLAAILTKAEAHAAARKIDRGAPQHPPLPDMFAPPARSSLRLRQEHHGAAGRGGDSELPDEAQPLSCRRAH
jgi:hypothetical protein